MDMEQSITLQNLFNTITYWVQHADVSIANIR